MPFTADAEAFLVHHHLHVDQIDMEHWVATFLAEMERGLAGEPSSLAMLPTYITLKNEIPVGKEVMVLDAGGTNFRCCLVSFNDRGEPSIRSYQKHPMPGSRGEVSEETFFSLMASYAEPLADETDTIGFCFSYATEITPQRDGRLLYFSKEIRAPEVIGKLVGSSLVEYLGGSKKWHICVLNDTVATLLAGRAYAGEKHDAYIGFILGTGTNTSYLEDSSRITKITPDTPIPDRQIINVESGGFDFLETDAEASFYGTTKEPEQYRFEKNVAGAYLGPLVLHVVKRACADGLFHPDTACHLESLDNLSTREMDDLLHTPDAPSVLSNAAGDRLDDRDRLYCIADRIVERSAKLSAVNLSATVLKSGAGTDPDMPACIHADGTTFLKTHFLRTYTQQYLEAYLKRCGRYCEMIHGENAPIVGAAIAGLQNR